MADDEQPDHTEDPRKQEEGTSGYPEVQPGGGGGSPTEREGDAGSPPTHPSEGDREKTTGNPNAG